MIETLKTKIQTVKVLDITELASLVDRDIYDFLSDEDNGGWYYTSENGVYRNGCSAGLLLDLNRFETGYEYYTYQGDDKKFTKLFSNNEFYVKFNKICIQLLELNIDFIVKKNRDGVSLANYNS